MLFLMACHDVSIGNPCDAEFVLSEPSLYTYSLARRTIEKLKTVSWFIL